MSLYKIERRVDGTLVEERRVENSIHTTKAEAIRQAKEFCKSLPKGKAARSIVRVMRWRSSDGPQPVAAFRRVGNRVVSV